MPLVTATEAQADHALMRAMLAGDASAFEALYRKYQAGVYRFALLRSGSADTACDIVQDVFVSLMTGALKFDPLKGALGSFLVGVARNFLLKRDSSRTKSSKRRIAAASSRSAKTSNVVAVAAHRNSARCARSPRSAKMPVRSGISEKLIVTAA